MKNKKGSILLEAILATVVLAMIAFSIFPLLSFLLKRTERSKYEPQASTLLSEGMEATYNILISAIDWNSYATETNYRLAKTASNKWQLLTGTESDIETRYTRNISFTKACRDNNGFLVLPQDYVSGACPGTLDINSRVITVNITWKEAEVNKILNANLLVLNVRQ